MKKVGLSSSDLQVKKGYEDLLSPSRLQNHSALMTEFRRVEVLDEFFTKFHNVVLNNDKILREMGENEKRMANLLSQKAKILTRDNPSETDVAFADFLNKMAETDLTLSASHSRHEVVRQASVPYNSFNSELMRAKDQLGNYLEIREFFLSSSAKVRSLNTASKKVVLSKLEKLEESRDEFGDRFDRADEEVRETLKQIQDKSTCEIMDNVASSLEERLNYHRSLVAILEQVSVEVERQKELVHQHRKGQELAQKKKDELKASSKRQTISWDQPGPTLVSDPSVVQSLCYKVQFPAKFDCFSDRDKMVIQHYFDLTSRSLSMSNGVQYLMTEINAARRMKKHNVIKMRSIDGLEWNFTVKTPSEREKWMECFWFVKYGLDRPVDVRASTVPLAEPIKILVGTWNMGDAPPKFLDDPIETWLPPGYDIYCISTQECNYTPRPGYANVQADFYQWISDHLGSEYVKLAATNLLSIRLGVFIRRTHYHKISNLRYATVATGIANIYGNKGGAGIAFNLYDKSFCFLGAHLAARIDRGRLAVRNQNYRDIIARMPFTNACSDIHNEFDYFFWTGDLNYRIEWDRDRIISCADNGQYEELLKYDQLMQERAAGNCFFQFTEGAINFKPTYRFDRGSRKWSDEKMREPAWCDRVLWKCPYPENVKQIAYLPAHGLMTSDHSPVYAGFVVHVPYPPFPHQRTPVQIQLSNIKGYDCLIEKEQKLPSMVFLSFQAPWLDPAAPSFSGPSIGTFPAPQWADTSIPPLVPLTTSHDFLSRQWLRVVVRSKSDVTKSSILGSGVIPLGVACGLIPAPFSIFLTDRGIQSGILTGEIFVNFLDKEYVAPTYVQESVVASGIASSAAFRNSGNFSAPPTAGGVAPAPPRPASMPLRPASPPGPQATQPIPEPVPRQPPPVQVLPRDPQPGQGRGGPILHRNASTTNLSQSGPGGRGGRGGPMGQQQQQRPKSASIPSPTPAPLVENETPVAANPTPTGGRGGIHMQVQFGGGQGGRGGARGGRGGGEGGNRPASISRGGGPPKPGGSPPQVQGVQGGQGQGGQGGQGPVGQAQGQGQAHRPRVSLGESARGARGGARGGRGGRGGAGLPGAGGPKRPMSAQGALGGGTGSLATVGESVAAETAAVEEVTIIQPEPETVYPDHEQVYQQPYYQQVEQVYEQPQQPVYEQPQQPDPVYQQPESVYQQPEVTQQPEPVYQQPEPVYEQPQQPVYEQPQQPDPVYQQPEVTQQPARAPSRRPLPQMPQQQPFIPQPTNQQPTNQQPLPQPPLTGSGIEKVLGQVDDLLSWLGPAEGGEVYTDEGSSYVSYDQYQPYQYPKTHTHEKQQGEGVVLGIVGSSSEEDEGDEEQALAALDAAFSSDTIDDPELARQLSALDGL